MLKIAVLSKDSRTFDEIDHITPLDVLVQQMDTLSSPIDDPAVALLIVEAEGIDVGAVLATTKSVPVIVLSNDCDQSKMVSWFRAGASDCLSVFDRSRLKEVVASHLAPLRLRRSQRSSSDLRIASVSDVMTKVLNRVKQVATTDVDVLVLGERGTGKSHTAGLCGGNADSLVKLECDCIRRKEYIPFLERLSHRAKSGRRRGVVLENVDRLDTKAGQDLAQFISSTRPRFRWIMTATGNVPFAGLDNIETIQLAPLRERGDDLPELSSIFTSRLIPGRPITIRNEVLDVFRCYHWPENLHELNSVLKAATVVMHDDTITVKDLPHGIFSQKETPATLKQGRSLGELDVLKRTLEECNYHRTKTANALGISRTALYKRMAKYDLL